MDKYYESISQLKCSFTKLLQQPAVDTICQRQSVPHLAKLAVAAYKEEACFILALSKINQPIVKKNERKLL